MWVNFRSFLNHHLHLRSIVTHWLFDPLIAILILVSVINAWYYMYNYNLVFGVLDTFFVFFFVLEIFAKVVALGPT